MRERPSMWYLSQSKRLLVQQPTRSCRSPDSMLESWATNLRFDDLGKP